MSATLRRWGLNGAVVVLAILLAGGAEAAPEKRPGDRPRTTERREIPPAVEPAPSEPETPPLYEPDMLKLAEILGSLAFLSDLCEPGDAGKGGGPFRSKAEALLDAEGMTELRRQRFAGAFNRGLSGYATVYRRCTGNARLSIERLKSDGAALARDLTSRFGG